MSESLRLPSRFPTNVAVKDASDHFPAVSSSPDAGRTLRDILCLLPDDRGSGAWLRRPLRRSAEATSGYGPRAQGRRRTSCQRHEHRFFLSVSHEAVIGIIDRDPNETNPQIPDHANDPGFAAFLKGEGSGDVVPVLVLSDALARGLGTTARAVLLSCDTALKQLKHALAPADYARLERIVERGTMLRSRDRHLEFVLEDDGPWHAVLKVTRDGREVYVQSLRRTNKYDIARLQRWAKRYG